MTEEKIPVPASILADQEKDAKRRANIGEWRQWLATKQQEELEESPYGRFQSRIPIEALKSFTSEERDELMVSEELEYNRLKPLAQARDEQHRAFVQAGGDAENFDAIWEGYGKDIHIAEVAAESIERAKRSSSPY
ncbi:MAG: hypothetical protein M3426_16905 [Actinomycetota bacterium]|nr:hypothetical protein [Actinomycetota bacterium]